MNIPCNLEFYRQIVEFENDNTKAEILFRNLDRPQQRALQSLAHNRNLEYEYQNGSAKIFRNSCGVVLGASPHENLSHGFDDPMVGLETWQSSQIDPPLFNSLINSNLQEIVGSQCNDSLFQPDIQIDLQKNPSSTDGELNLTTSGMSSSNQILPDEPISSKPQHFSDWNMGSFAGNTIPTDTTYPGNEYNVRPGSNNSWINDSWHNSNSSLASSVHEASPNANSFGETSAVSPAEALSNNYLHSSRPNSVLSPAIRSPIALPKLTPLHRHETTQTQGHELSSRSNSVSSLQSERGRNNVTKSFGRTSSVRGYSPGMRDYMSSPMRDNSSTRASSGASGRIGPLDYVARMGMKAVKAVGGACWRCKILGKKVVSRSPFTEING